MKENLIIFILHNQYYNKHNIIFLKLKNGTKFSYKFK